jgi:hypothetical protein
MRFVAAALVLLLLSPQLAPAEDLVIQVPAGAKAVSAKAENQSLKMNSSGKVEGSTVQFTKLLPGTPYDVTIELADGHVLRGVNMKWYNEEPVDPRKEPLSDDDRNEIAELVKPDKDFMNKQEILHLAGDHNRATALVKLVRDRDFHSDKGGEIICRFELWYYRFEAGGWMKVAQTQKVLQRDRFGSSAAYQKAVAPIRWVPELGGITLDKGAAAKTVTLTSTSGVQPASPTTRAAE